jgi:hypothetical protein
VADGQTDDGEVIPICRHDSVEETQQNEQYNIKHHVGNINMEKKHECARSRSYNR